MPPEYVQALVIERAKRARAKHANQARRITIADRVKKLHAAMDTHPKQKAFVEDPSITKFALCTARAGKTFADAVMLIEDSCDPVGGFDTAYVTLTLKEAKRIMWNGPSGLKALNREYDLGLRFNNADLVATTETGHQIVMAGAETEDDIEKLRGQPFKRVVVDEAQSFRPHIDKMIKEVLVPRLLDYGGGIALTGTPGEILAGFFYEVTSGKMPGWGAHKWSLFDNPHIPKVKTPEVQNVRDFIKVVMRRLGWTEESPAYQREMLGRWVRDESSLVYLHSDRNLVKKLPQIRGVLWRYVGGLDLGWSERKETLAIEVGAWSPDRPEAYLIEGHKSLKLSLDELAAVLFTLSDQVAEITRRRLRPEGGWPDNVQAILNRCGRFPGMTWVGDPGGMGASILAQLEERYGISIQLAEKTEKVANIKTMNGELAARPPRLYVVEGNPIVTEWEHLQWAIRADLKDKREEDPRFPNHYSDAGLYLWRHLYHFLHEHEDPGPEEGSEAYFEAMAEKMENDDEEEALEHDRRQWWEKDE